MSNEHPNIANRDWRLQAITTLAEDFKSPFTGKLYKAGAAVEVTGYIKYKKDLVCIPVPNPVAIYLSLARKVRDRGTEFVARRFPGCYMSLTDGFKQFSFDAEAELFNALENLIACIVFSYSAIEAFANGTIPDNFQFEWEGRTPKKSDHGCKRLYSKDEIQRYLPLDVELDKILPGICSVCSPQGTKLWQNYVWLKKLRDCCIHLKSSDWQHSGPENAPNYFWTKLMSRKVQKAPEFAFSLIQHYYPQDQPRWMRKFSLFSDPTDSIRESVRVG